MTEPVVPRRLSIIRKGGESDERSRSVPLASRLIQRPELGALAGTVLVILFFAAVAGNSGLFSARASSTSSRSRPSSASWPRRSRS